MISILPADEEYLKRTVSSLNLGLDALCLAARDGDLVLGHIVYRLVSRNVELLDLKAQDSTIADGLIRAALNLALRKGAEFTKSGNPEIIRVIENISGKRFEGQGDYQLDISSLFAKKCC